MQIRLIVTGKTSEAYLREGMSMYLQRLKRYVSFELIEIPVKTVSSSGALQLRQEAEKILGLVKSSEFIVLLDERGEQLSSEALALKIGKLQNQGISGIVFIIGGAYGFHSSVYERADYRLSLSAMTFTHQMVRLIFMEQLYRAFTILKNEKYHH